MHGSHSFFRQTLFIGAALFAGESWTQPQYGAEVEFFTQRTAGYGQATAQGDVDQDGDLDMVVAHNWEMPVLLYRNLGGGVYDPEPIGISSASALALIMLRDIDGDTDLDLLGYDSLASALVLMENPGTYPWGAPAVLISGIAKFGASAYVDVNNDGLDDLFVRQVGSYSIVLYSGLGNGQFAPPQPLTQGAFHLVTDLDSDSDPDLVYSENQVTYWLPNDGMGGFTGPLQIAVTSGPMLATDHEGDGDIDLLNNWGMQILTNDGSEQFTIQLPFDDVCIVRVIASTDFDGTMGAEYLGYAHDCNSFWTQAPAWYNDSQGWMSEMQLDHFTTGGSSSLWDLPAFAAYDMDGDSDNDVLVSRSCPAYTYWVENRLDQGENFLGKRHVLYSEPFLDPNQPLVADLDGNGADDLLYTERFYPVSTAMISAGGGGFNESPVFDTHSAGAIQSCHTGDLDSDGDMDIVQITKEGLPNFDQQLVLCISSAGQFGPPMVLDSVDADPIRFVSVANVDGTGAPDIITTSYGNPMVMAVYHSTGSLTYSPRTVVATILSSSGSARIMDLDGDGPVDIVTWNPQTDSVMVRWNDGAGAFAPAVLVSGQVESPRSLDVADLDQDGILDLVIHSGPNTLPGSIHWLQGSGGGTFAAPQMIVDSILTNWYWYGDYQTRQFDADGDGDPDFLATAFDITSWSLFLNDGTAGFTKVGLPGSMVYWNLDPADVDGDGLMDLVYKRYIHSCKIQLGVMLNLGVLTNTDVPLPGHFAVFPNPAQAETTVAFDPIDRRIPSMEIKDVSGRTLIKVIPDTPAGTRLDLTGFSPGTYLVTLRYEGHAGRVTKLVVY